MDGCERNFRAKDEARRLLYPGEREKDSRISAEELGTQLLEEPPEKGASNSHQLPALG